MKGNYAKIIAIMCAKIIMDSKIMGERKIARAFVKKKEEEKKVRDKRGEISMLRPYSKPS